MAKKAFLVVTTFVTRVVVDEDLENENNYNELVEKTADNIIAKINNGETSESIEAIRNDDEMPYGSIEGEK